MKGWLFEFSVVNAWVGFVVSFAIVCASCSKRRMCLFLCSVSPQHKPHFVQSKRMFTG